MDRRAVKAELRRIADAVGAEQVVLRGDDGRTLRLNADAALDLFLDAASGSIGPGLPEHLGRWIAEHAAEGPHDITGTLVRTYRATHGTKQKEKPNERHEKKHDQPPTPLAQTTSAPKPKQAPTLVPVEDPAERLDRERTAELDRRYGPTRRQPTEEELDRRLEREKKQTRGGTR